MSEVGTPPPHNLDKPHVLVASNNNNNQINGHTISLVARLIVQKKKYIVDLAQNIGQLLDEASLS